MSYKDKRTRLILALTIVMISVIGCLGPTTIPKQVDTPGPSFAMTRANPSPTSLPLPAPSSRARSPSATGTLGFEQQLAACHAIPNQSVQQVTETTRLFINLPKAIYPDKSHNLRFTTVEGDATAGYISNAGLPGEAFQATPDCWSYYYEFDGNGEVDLQVSSALEDYPDYFVRFLVGSH